jgi:hypothetical protein
MKWSVKIECAVLDAFLGMWQETQPFVGSTGQAVFAVLELFGEASVSSTCLTEAAPESRSAP